MTQAPSLQGLTYACDLNKASLLSFISGISPPMFPAPVDISAAIPTALSLFTSNPTTGSMCMGRRTRAWGRDKVHGEEAIGPWGRGKVHGEEAIGPWGRGYRTMGKRL